MQKTFFAVIDKSASGSFGATFPDFPGCVSAGETIAEAIESAGRGLQFHIDGMVEGGDPLPDPSDPEAFEKDPEIDLACIAAVSVQVPGPIKRVTMTIPEDVLNRVDEVASNRSGFFAEAAREKLKAG